MNAAAKAHLAKANEYVDRGEQFYRMAAEQILAALNEGATQTEAGKELKRSQAWVSYLLKWHQDPDSQGSVFSHDTPRRTRDATTQTLREAPMEQVEQIIAALPKERQQAIGAAAGHEYMKARQEQDEAAQRRTPAEQRERDQARESLTRPIRQAVSDFTSLGIVGHLDQATDELRELTADASLTPQAMRKIERADEAWREALDFAKALVGREDES